MKEGSSKEVQYITVLNLTVLNFLFISHKQFTENLTIDCYLTFIARV